MNRSTLRIAIIVLALTTAVIHLILAGMGLSSGGDAFTVPFILNGIGYLALLAAMFANVPYFKDNRPLAHYLMMAFAAATLVAYFIANGFTFGPMAIIAKTAEVLLIIATFLHLRAAS